VPPVAATTACHACPFRTTCRKMSSIGASCGSK
jgi:hypothetical protein